MSLVVLYRRAANITCNESTFTPLTSLHGTERSGSPQVFFGTVRLEFFYFYKSVSLIFVVFSYGKTISRLKTPMSFSIHKVNNLSGIHFHSLMYLRYNQRAQTHLHFLNTYGFRSTFEHLYSILK